MASDKLYKLAFQYKNTKLWKKLYDDEIFAVKLPDGKTGYISIMGMAGDYNAIGLYVGSEGFNSYRIVADIYMSGFESQLLYQECLLRQECLQCTFQNKSELSMEEADEVKDYAIRNNITLRGRNSYPQFVKYRAGYCPWVIQTGQDEDYMEAALKASVALAGMLDGKSPQDIGIGRVNKGSGTVILLEPAGNGYKTSSTELPEALPEKYIVPGLFNDINVAKLKNTEKRGIWECELVQYPEPVRNSPEEVPHFPMMFLAAEADTGFILPISPVEYFSESCDKMMDMVVEAFLMQDICPKTIHVRDERSYYFLEGLCKKIKTKLILQPELPSLDDAEEDLLEYIGSSEEENLYDIMSVFNTLLEGEDKNLRNLPDAVVKQFEILAQSGILPEEFAEKLNGAFNFTGDGSAKNKNNVIPINIGQPGLPARPAKSYIISVSCYKGCYRHIQISADCLLSELHEAILESFGFDDDHAHVFFMDNVKWSRNEAYYMEGMEAELYTSSYTLRDAGLEKGMQFKYLFDFGECWLFQCKVLRVIEEETKEPFVVRSKGEAPEQYPDYDD